MNLTNANIDKKIQEAFKNEILPLAKELIKKGKSYYIISYNKNADSYYESRNKVSLSSSDFESESCQVPENLEEALKEYWNSTGDIELIRISKTLGDISKMAHKVEKENISVSPLIYVMF